MGSDKIDCNAPKLPNRKLETGKRTSPGFSLDSPRPLVSVITVVYNNVSTLQRCITSVISQRDVSFEYIVIDGGSTDGTIDIIRKNSEHIDYAISEPDEGIYDAMNKGISLARGTYIALINSDDWLEPDGLSISVENILAAGADVSIGYANVYDKDGEFSHIWKIGNFDVRILTSGMSFCHQALIASRRAYDEVGSFDQNYNISADYKWVKQLFLSDLKFVFTEVPVVNFSLDGISANNREVWKLECKEMLLEQFPFLSMEDISAFLEYVYKDAALDHVAAENLIISSPLSSQFLQSISLVLLDKLTSLELKRQNVVSERNRVRRLGLRGGSAVQRSGAATKSEAEISVVIPVYNVESYLEECLRSVLSQTFERIEVICVNDGSTDESRKILQEFVRQDHRVKVIDRPNGGLSAARNTGIEAATGKYVHFLDSDDYIKQGMYEALYSAAVERDLDVVKSNLGFIDDVYPIKKPPQVLSRVMAFDECPEMVQFISPCSALYSRGLLEKVSRFAEGMTYEDRPFNWETLLAARRIGHVDEVFYMYRVGRPGSIMSTRVGSMRHFDSFLALDQIHNLLRNKGLLDRYSLEYVKEQLRVYSMLIDIRAIPREAHGRFFWEIHSRLNSASADLSEVLNSNLPQRAKALFAFFSEDVKAVDLEMEGEKYFFYGINYAEKDCLYRASSCELSLIADEYVDRCFSSETCSDKKAFKTACFASTMFDEIHCGRVNSVSDLLGLMPKLKSFFCCSREFNYFSDLLHCSPEVPFQIAVDHFCFQYSTAHNYLRSIEDLRAYFKGRSHSFFVGTSESIRVFGVPSDIKKAEEMAKQLLKSLGVRTNAFSQTVSACRFFQRGLDWKELRSFTVLFPRSPEEFYFIKVLQGRCQIIFLPHGLPQLSVSNFDPDVVLTITREDVWGVLFPGARHVHIGWTESRGLQSDVVESRSVREVIFLSQLEGGRLHKLCDFVEAAHFFIRSVLDFEQDHFSFNFRLRNLGEMEFLDAGLVDEVRKLKNFRFSVSTDSALSEVPFDLLIGCTSTGLLHAQRRGAAGIQLVSERLIQHWPFSLASSDMKLSIDASEAELVKLLQDVSERSVEFSYYEEMTMGDLYVAFDAVYPG